MVCIRANALQQSTQSIFHRSSTKHTQRKKKRERETIGINILAMRHVNSGDDDGGSGGGVSADSIQYRTN